VTCLTFLAFCVLLLVGAISAFGDGISYADSQDFTLDTTGVAPDIGGVAYADSANFTLDTTGTTPGVGGVAYSDSGNFILDTTGVPSGIGGVAYADSANFTLDTTGPDGYEVVTLADGGAGSLRQAIASATQNSVITFVPGLAGTITLTGGELVIGKSLTIIGPGATNLTINGNKAGRVFNVQSGENVVVSGLTIANGLTNNANGGGIYNAGNLTLINCALSNNRGFGSANGGGALCNAVSGSAWLYNCCLVGNTGGGGGGGGGAILNLGSVSLFNCTLYGNYSDGSGGGINSSGVLLVNHCTIYGNTVDSDVLFDSKGGGVYGNSVLAANQTVEASIIAHNEAPSSGYDVWGVFNSAGFNLIQQPGGSSGWIASGIGADLTGLEPHLGPLQDNGGPTLTMALLPGSPAIDAGNSFGLTNDQRGQFRPSDSLTIPNATGGDGSDIGAFEVAQTIIVPTLSVIFAAPNSVIVSWPSPSTGFTLQTNGNLATGTWVNYGGIVGDNGTIKTETISPPVGNLFFRLSHP
jgi:hypothetical protein